MSLIKCPECAKEISDKSGKCPYCGYPINLITKAKQKCNNKKLLYFSIGIIICIGAFFILIILNSNADKKKYCNGLEWGTSLKLVDKEYSPLDKSSVQFNVYHGACDSLDGYKSDNKIYMTFYFNDNDELIKIEASIVDNEINEAILYFVNYYNKIYKQNYTQDNYKYKWFGEKTNVTMKEYTDTAVLDITYEPSESVIYE